MVPEKIADLIRSAHRITVLTGAGMSAESGVPTFRDAQTGLWARYDPMTLATVEAFEEDPGLVWAWYLRRLQLVRSVSPNRGHYALASLGMRRHVEVVTQNVDDLHERAGSEVLAHLHGSLSAYHCFECGRPHGEAVEPPAEIEERIAPPYCTDCGGRIRPGIVWFGEMLPQEAFQNSVEACEESDLVLVVGTSGLVYPAAGLPMMALGAGVPVVEINPAETMLSDRMTVSWRTTAAEGLPELLEVL